MTRRMFLFFQRTPTRPLFPPAPTLRRQAGAAPLTLDRTPPGELLVFLNGLLAQPGVDYTVNNNIVTPSAATDATVQAVYWSS